MDVYVVGAWREGYAGARGAAGGGAVERARRLLGWPRLCRFQIAATAEVLKTIITVRCCFSMTNLFEVQKHRQN